MGSCRGASGNAQINLFSGGTRPVLAGPIIYLRSMQIVLAHIGPRPSSKDPLDGLTAMYLERCGTHARCQAEAFRSEEALFEWMDRHQRRAPAVCVLLDSRGKQMSSEGFADWLRKRRDDGAQQIVFSIGPADGWSEGARKRATLLLSLGTFTLAHALARVVLAEQLYRAFTILTGHPYHSGH
jgi:23S rRNA (pseudouridine1915-N3)-methyltransferase